MEFDFSKCDSTLTQARVNEIKQRTNMLVALNDLLDEPCGWRFLKNFDDEMILDFALFFLRQHLDGEIDEHDIGKIIEKISMIGD